jgi:hypothetical protein
MSKLRKPSGLWRKSPHEKNLFVLQIENSLLKLVAFQVPRYEGYAWKLSHGASDIQKPWETIATLEEAQIAAENALREFHEELAKAVDLITQKEEQ